MASSGRVVVLHTDLPHNATRDDLDVLFQVAAVSDTLEQMGFEVCSLPFSLDTGFPSALACRNPSLVFNLVESVSSRGRWCYLAPALLERMGIHYTGCSASSMLLTTNKIATKTFLRHLQIPTPPWVSILNTDEFVADDTYIIKPLDEDASIGLDSESVMSFRESKDVEHLLCRTKEQWGIEFFAERFIDGREFSISVLGENGKPRILTPSEIRFAGYDERHKAKILDYSAKWETDSFEYQNTFSVTCVDHQDHALLREMRAISEKCWSFFALRGYARIDFRVDKEGNPWVLEINTNPCITPGDSGFLKSAKESGFDFGDVISRIIGETRAHDCPIPYSERYSVI